MAIALSVPNAVPVALHVAIEIVEILCQTCESNEAKISVLQNVTVRRAFVA
jgi:hypothetical protein